MNVLEKILEEIKEKCVELSKNHWGDDERHLIAKGIQAMYIQTEKIIRSHMNDVTDTNIPSNDGWIPVEDGLPEEGGEVEVTIEEMADSAGGMIYYTKTAWVQEERWVIKRNPYNPRVIAWRPLPEPYKPKKLQTEEKPVQ